MRHRCRAVFFPCPLSRKPGLCSRSGNFASRKYGGIDRWISSKVWNLRFAAIAAAGAPCLRVRLAALYSEDGREYLDFFSGAGALNYGHNNPVLLRPLVEYLLSGAIVHSLDMKTPAKRRFLETFGS